MNDSQGPSLEVVYDGECPFCRSYVAYCRLKEAFPDVRLTDARAAPERVAAYRAHGMDVNEGMIVILGEATYFGDEAMAVLAEISRPDGVLQRIMRAAFARPGVGRVVYAGLKAGRNATLFLLGRRKIE